MHSTKLLENLKKLQLQTMFKMVRGKTKDYNFAWESPILKADRVFVSCGIHVSVGPMFPSSLVFDFRLFCFWIACYIHESSCLSYIYQHVKIIC